MTCHRTPNGQTPNINLYMFQYTLEIFDPEWDEWILIREGDEIPGVEKLKVRLVLGPVRSPASIASASTVPVSQMIDDLQVGEAITLE